MISLHQNEKVVIASRKHWLPITMESITLAIIAFLPLILIAIFGAVAKTAEGRIALFINSNENVFYFFALLWAFLLWISFFISWTNYYLDIIVITDRRVVDVEQIGLFSRDIVELPIEKVQDIKVEVLGIIPSFLDFGNIYIQSAGASPEIVVHKVRRPHEVKDAISRVQHTTELKTENPDTKP